MQNFNGYFHVLPNLKLCLYRDEPFTRFYRDFNNYARIADDNLAAN